VGRAIFAGRTPDLIFGHGAARLHFAAGGTEDFSEWGRAISVPNKPTQPPERASRDKIGSFPTWPSQECVSTDA
jgi:hypothetical protein